MVFLQSIKNNGQEGEMLNVILFVSSSHSFKQTDDQSVLHCTSVVLSLGFRDSQDRQGDE